MHIFIDETGSFTGIGKSPSISLVGALIVPDSRLASLEKKYRKLRKSFPKDDKGEVKGRLLNEQQIARVVPLLFEHSALSRQPVSISGYTRRKGSRHSRPN